MKKISLSLLLVMVLVLSTMSGFVFADTPAETLYDLELLSGDGVSFNLDQQLKRQDAAAFIVKFLGRNNHVSFNQNVYSRNNFSDVNTNDWFAPYVGYLVEEGVISGYADGTFKPTEPVSEKAFLKMLLVAIGYEYEEDFDWNSVYKTAFESGVVEDLSYTVKTDDTYDYKRGQVVEALYNALDQRINGTNETPLRRLVRLNVVSKNKVEDLGYDLDESIDDEKSSKDVSEETPDGTYITDVKVLSNSAFEFFIKDQSKADVFEGNHVSINLYDDNEDRMLTKNMILDREEGKVTIEVYDDLVEEPYMVEVTLADLDSDDVVTLEKVFEGETIGFDDYFESAFKVDRIDVLSKKAIEVFFTHPVGEKAEASVYYRIKRNNTEFIEGNFKTLAVSSDTGHANSIKIWLLEDTLEENVEYSLILNGQVESAYTAYLNNADGQEVTFEGVEDEPSKLELDELQVVDDDYIRLVFNKALDPETALDPDNYSMDAVARYSGYYNSANDVQWAPTDRYLRNAVDVKFLNMDNEQEYELEINYIRDADGFSEIVNFEKPFLANYVEREDNKQTPRIRKVDVLNNQTLKVYFYDALGKGSEDAEVRLRGENVENVIWDPSDPDVLMVYLGTTFKHYETEDLRIVGNLYNQFGQEADEVVEKEDIDGTSKELDDLEITNAVFIAKNKIKVDLNRWVEGENSMNLDDYILRYEDEDNKNYEIDAEEVNFIDNRVIIVTFDEDLEGRDFRLFIKDMTDITSLRADDLYYRLDGYEE